jgi:uncharacterized protein YbjT (DUF2867 family)
MVRFEVFKSELLSEKEKAVKIAVTTPTGHVGSVVVDFLLDSGDDISVTLLGRRATTLRSFIERGAQISIGSQDDPDHLVEATQGVDALLWVTPPGYGSDNVRAFQNRLGKAAATAIRANRIPRVVNLSSIGAQFVSGVGPISGLHDVESWLDDTASNVTHLRPGFFFENLLGQLDSIRNWGRISLPLSGSRRYPMIATRDIAHVAAERLLDRSWTGHSVRELHGPAELCYDEVAGILSEALGRKIVYIKCNREEAHQYMLDNAISENAAELMLEMYDAIEMERLRPIQRRTVETTTTTSLVKFVYEVMLPMFAEPVAH